MIPAHPPAGGPWRLIRSIQHALVYHARVKRALARTDSVRMFGVRLEVPPGVFHPKVFRTTRVIGRHILSLDLRGRSVLDMGCGSGVLALLAARGGARVTAVDINPAAAGATRANAAANNLGVSVHVSDLFSSLPRGDGFDWIIWNPPFYPAEAADMATRAWYAGSGYSVLGTFAGTAGAHLRPGGRLIVQLSTEIDQDRVLGLFAAHGFTPALAARTRLPFETLSIYHFDHADP